MAMDAGVTATAGSTVITYGQFTSSANNDCPTQGAPTSLTVQGLQTDPQTSMTFSIVLCLPQPNKIGSAPISITNTDLVRVINVNAGVSGCNLTLDRTVPLSGTVQFSGFCSNGTSPQGYALSFNAGAGGELVCPTDGGSPMVTKQQIALAGTAAVTAAGQAAVQTAAPR